MRRTPVLIALALSVSALSGCSSSVPADDLAEQVSAQLESQVGQTPDDVMCPEDLAAEVGAEVTCELTDGEDVYDVALVVTEVDDSDVLFDITVADAPN